MSKKGKSLRLACHQNGPSRRRVAFERQCRILGVEKVGQRVEGHPLGAALFLQRCRGLVDDADVLETAALEPV